jgi:nitroreductase
VREDLAAHLEAWRGLRRFSPPGILDALVLVATVAACFAAQRLELAWLFAGWLDLGSVRELFSVVGLVEELGLNTRIWSKAPKGAPIPA